MTERRHVARIPIVRKDRDGAVIDGTAELLEEEGTGHLFVTDFRDLDGIELPLPPGSSFDVVVPLDQE